jgi:hypothetical protein
MGASLLTLRQSNDYHLHHITMNIAPQHFEQAIVWAAARVTLLPFKGRNFIDFSQSKWKAKSIYFEDTVGNVLEFIARERAPMPHAPESFGVDGIINISEVGLASANLPALVKDLQTALRVPIFDGDPKTGFCALGNDEGLFICVETGRNWLPTDNRPSAIYPIAIHIGDCGTGIHTFEGGAYTLTCRAVANAGQQMD